LDSQSKQATRRSIVSEPPEAAVVGANDWSPAGADVGGAGIRKFVFSIRMLGTVKLDAKLWRPWTGEGSVVERLEFTFHVS
jgi:hypothetical protein